MSINHDKSNLTDNPGVAFKPPILLGIFILVGFAGRWLFGFSFLPQPWSFLIGPIVIGLAIGLFVWAVRTMRQVKTGIDTDDATTTILSVGPFQFSRNPIYLAMVLLLIGLGISANTLWFIGLAILFFILLTLGVIHREETYLEKKFGSDYLSY